MIRRLRKIALWVLAIVIGVPVLVLLAGNLPPVQRLIERQVASLSGGMVRLAGLHGRFPDALRLDHLEIADAKGTWLSAEGLALDWSPADLVFLTAHIDLASIDHLAVLRQPIQAASTQPASAQGTTSLPVRIDVRALRIARADIAAAVAGSGFAAQLQGSALIHSLRNGQADVTLTRLDGPGRYHVDGVLHPDAITAHVSVHEPPGGLLATLGKLQGLGGIAIEASLDGPKSAEQAHLAATAGALRATLAGSADIPDKQVSLNVDATAPAMHPRADIAWSGIDLHAHVAGSFTRPDATGHLSVRNLAAAGAGFAALQADLAGNAGSAAMHAVVTGVRIPGKKTDLLAAAPVDMTATVNLAAPDRPAHLHITHTLLTADADARTAGAIAATIHAALPDLAPLAQAAGIDVHGHATLTAALTSAGAGRDITASGSVTIDGGATPPPGLHGDTKFDVAAIQTGSNIEVQHATVDNANLHLDAAGSSAPDAVALNFHATAPNLGAFSPQAEGAVTATGKVIGPPQNLAVVADIRGDAGSPQYGKGPLAVTLNATNLPGAPNADIAAKIFIAGADAVLTATANTDNAGVMHAKISRADWKSVRIRADVTTPKGGIPAGKLDITAANLGDFSALTGQALGGSLHAALVTTEANATVRVDGKNLSAGARRIAALTLNARATGVQSDPDLNGVLTLDGIDAQGVTGAAKLTALGRTAALHLHAIGGLENLQGAPARFDSAVLLDAQAKRATLESLTADWKSLAARLQGASRIEFGDRIAVDRLRLAINEATLDVAGQFGPTLNFSANLRNVTPDLGKPFAPGLHAGGMLTADAHLTGPQAAPSGVVHLTAAGLRLHSGPAASLPAANIAATATFAGGSARIDARLDAGAKLHLAARGSAPLNAGGPLALRTTGTLDLTLLNPILQAGGRQAKGTAGLDITATGTPRKPAIAGRVTLANADIQDFVQGFHLAHIDGQLDATGDTLTITRLTTVAGPGTLNVTGSMGITQPTMPVDLHITARNARPLASDLLTTVFDADILLRGQAAASMNATGTINLHRMDINIPDSLPPSVATLNVRRPGQLPPRPPTGPAAAPAEVHLAIDVDAPGSIFVRGKGLDAEMAGSLHIRGTNAAPLIEGGFSLRRGDFSLAGTTLNFSKGDVSFNGTGVSHRIDPTLDFEADSYSGNITATLAITGYADAPKISLSSVPDLPQDEVLAHLLFGQSMSQLSALQIAEIGAALAEISGITGGGEGPLGAIRKGLGLDRLSVGGGSGGAGTSVEAGRYVAKGVYVGTKQSTSGAGGTQVQVQVDLTRRLKLNTTLGTGGGTAQGATPDNDPGSSIGLSYGFEY